MATSGTVNALQSAVESKHLPAFAAEDDRGRHVWQEEQRFYKQNGYAPVWSDGRKLRGSVDGLLRAIRAADQEGLDPADYGVDDLAALRQSFDPSHAADADIRFTYAYLRYAWDLANGTIDPEDIDPKWHRAPRDVDFHEVLERAIGDNRVEKSLQELAPRVPQYQGLKHQLARYRDLAAKNPQATVPVPQDETGKTAAMAVADVVRTIAMNMDRWRWMPEDLGSRYLIVNIPAFRLDAIEDGKSVLEMKVVTGKKDNPTPVLADKMTTVVFSPYWNIPQDIVDKEILPKADKDPSYLERQNIEVDDQGRYRQRPGKGNSLGGVKFLFPNHYNVYLHDTPAEKLFARVERDFSHGCVRVERPSDLAKYVLRDQPQWTDDKIKAAMESGAEQSVALKQPLPIYLVYFTAWEENGELQLRPDVYGLDRRHGAAATDH